MQLESNTTSFERWVWETQLNFKVYQNIFLVLEHRYNDYERYNQSLDGEGLALGISMRF